MSANLNVPNLDKLIAHLEAQPPERINMGFGAVSVNQCGTCGCIGGHILLIWPEMEWNYDETADDIANALGVDRVFAEQLGYPRGYIREIDGVKRYPAHRVIDTLKRLRDRFLATGEVVVDWGAEPGSEPAQTWAAPQAVELTPPELPETLTRLLGAKVEA